MLTHGRSILDPLFSQFVNELSFLTRHTKNQCIQFIFLLLEGCSSFARDSICIEKEMKFIEKENAVFFRHFFVFVKFHQDLFSRLVIKR